MLEKLESKLTKEGVLQIVSQTERSQLGNKEIAIEKMYNTLNKCFVLKKKRKPTKPSRNAVEERLNAKKRNSAIKEMRRTEIED